MDVEKAKKRINKFEKFNEKYGLKIRFFVNGFIVGVMFCVVMMTIISIFNK